MLHPAGVLRSTDAGSTFEPVGKGLVGPCRSLVLSPAFERDRTVFATTRLGVHRSVDGGATFEHLPTSSAARSGVLAISPNHARDRMLLVGTANGLYRSRDGGESWERLDLGAAAEVEPISAVAISPDFARDREFLVQRRGGDLLICHDLAPGLEVSVSSSAASGFEFSSLPTFVREVSSLLVYSPRYATDRTVWASDVHRVLVSRDGGRTFTSLPRSARYESSHAKLSGAWTVGQGVDAGGSHRSRSAGSTATLRFVGTGVTWIGTHGPDSGRAQVMLDGAPVATVDQRAASRTVGVATYSIAGLPLGPHELTIVAGNAATAGTTIPMVDIDAFDVLLGP